MAYSDFHITAEPRKFLIFGGRGFIGSHLVDALLNLGHTVRCFDRPNVSILGPSHLDNPRFEFFEGDFTCEADIISAMNGCDVCYHLVSTTLPKSSNSDPYYDIESNVLGTISLLKGAVGAGIKKIIFISSGGTVYGRPVELPISETHPTEPVCSYGIAKLAIEKYLNLFHQLHGLDYTILRLSNPFGERQRTYASQGAVAVFLGRVLRNEPVEIWGDGTVTRDYIHISDVVSALLQAHAVSSSERLFNIGAGYGVSLNGVLDSIEEVTGCKADRRYLPGRPFDVPESILCIKRAKQFLQWAPNFSFEQGLKSYYEWYLNHPDI